MIILDRKIVKTSRNDVIKRMYNMVPYFTPEWKFDLDDLDPGSALFKLFLDMHMETIDLFNQVYEKNYVSFLNLFDATLLKPNSARCPVVFEPSSGASEHIVIEAGTKLLARSDEVVGFTTESVLEVIPTKLNHVLLTNGNKDKMVHYDGNSEVALFDFSGENVQEHHIYICENNILLGSHSVEFYVGLETINSKVLTNRDYTNLIDEKKIQWEYYSYEKWVKFDNVNFQEGSIVLEKNNSELLDTYEDESIQGHHRWIRAVIKDGYVKDFSKIKIGKITITPKMLPSGSKGLLVEKALNNTKGLDVNNVIMPFGNSFYEEDALYLSCDDVLSKANAEISMSFDLCFHREDLRNNIPDIDWKLIIRQSEINRYKIVDIKIRSVRWEFWNGQSWERLSIVNGEKVFTIEMNRRVTLKFKCPKNIQPYALDGENQYVIRGTINGVDNGFATYGRYLVPNINDVRFKYDYEDSSVVAKNCMIKNNNVLEDMTEIIGSHIHEFYPFQSIREKENTIFMCFSEAFGKGPNSMLFVMEDDKTDLHKTNKISISYLKHEKNELVWKNVEFEDQTNIFNRTGHLVFGNINSMAKSKIYGVEGYWFKCEFRHDEEIIKRIKSIKMNSVWAVQEEYMNSERFNVANESYNIELSQVPVLKEMVWVNEYSTISLDEIKEIKRKSRYKEVINEYGELEEFWVHWKKTNDLMSKKSSDRVYHIDPIAGLITFGNDINGKKIPISNNQQVSIDYTYGGGTKGNLEAYEVSNLDHAIAFIDTVYNPLPSVGGCNHESFEAAVDRASNNIRNQNRAVTIKDIESITKTASRNILKVKCIPNLNGSYKIEQGCIGVLVIPNQTKNEKLSIQLKKQIHDYLVARCPAQIVNTIHVSDPIYVTISIYGRFVSKDKLAGRMVNDEIEKKIDAFIDIKYGNFHGEGWDIGKLPNEIMLHSILSDIESIEKINSLNIFYSYEDYSGTYTIRSEDLKNSRFMIVNKGEYNIEIYQK